jgi:hypothetical protein
LLKARRNNNDLAHISCSSLKVISVGKRKRSSAVVLRSESNFWGKSSAVVLRGEK